MQKKALSCLIVLLNLYCPLSFANGWFIGGDLGVGWPNLASNDAISNGTDSPAPYNHDLYTIQSPGSDVIGSIFVGYLFTHSSIFFPHYSLALRYQRLTPFTVNGDVDQYSLPDFYNYTYSAKVSSNIYSVQTKADIYQFSHCAPYISFGLGEASNSASDYNETPAGGISARISPGYGKQITNNFMFNLGAGLDFNIRPSLVMSLGYEYENLGKVQTGNGTDKTWQNDSLSFGTLTINKVFLSLTYQFHSC